MRKKLGPNRCPCGRGFNSRGFCVVCDAPKETIKTGDVSKVMPTGHGQCGCMLCKVSRTKAQAICEGCGKIIGYDREYVRTDTGVMHLEEYKELNEQGT